MLGGTASYMPGPATFGYDGLGTVGFADPVHRFALGFMKNRLDWSDHMYASVSLVVTEIRNLLDID
jgi:hypothetical protein